MESTHDSMHLKQVNSSNLKFLSESARFHMEDIARHNWTDYNLHDPGITILELLTYVITDLNLRTQIEVGDILASGPHSSFLSGIKALPNAVHTEIDYHRFLLELPRLQNVRFNRAKVFSGQKLMKGLYELGIAIEQKTKVEGEIPGLLNESWVALDLKLNSHLIRFYIVIPIWEDLSESWKSNQGIESITLLKLPEALPGQEYVKQIVENDKTKFYAEAKVKYRFTHLVESIPVWIFPDPKTPPRTLVGAEILLADIIVATQDQGPFPRFWQRTQAILQEFRDLRKYLSSVRNFGEDIEKIFLLRIQQIGVEIQAVELEEDANPLEVLAQIYFTIDSLISPIIRPASFEELLQEGLEPSEIFDGPILKNGFIKDENVSVEKKGGNFYISDFINEIMKIPGVFALENLTLNSFVDRREVNKDVKNCLHLIDQDNFFPYFSVNDTTITLRRRGIDVTPNFLEIKNRYLELKIKRKTREKRPNELQDIPIPMGRVLPLGKYDSFQDDFPEIYGLREGAITESMSSLEQAQKKQLKAFLLFFEQVLANYCSQLVNFGELFSSDKYTERTYFYQPLYDIPAIRDLIAAFLTAAKNEKVQSWEEFKGYCNDHIKALNDAIEDQDLFRSRRHQFVNHLLARYSESFTLYDNWMKLVNKGAISPDWLMDKLTFLAEWPALSANRGQAFDYDSILPERWSTNNVSGLEKRVVRLLGIPNYSRRHLNKIFRVDDYLEIYDEIDRIEDHRREGRFRIWNAPLTTVYKDNPARDIDQVNKKKFKRLLSSTKRYIFDIGLRDELDKVLSLLIHRKHYRILQTESSVDEPCKYYLLFLDETMNTQDPIALRQGYFPKNRALLEEEIQTIIHLVEGRHMEGMHLIEHILLRPDSPSEMQLVSVQVNELQLPIDPYSYQISIFLPGWAGRFQDQEFRTIVERTIRQEAPVAILPWIYWVELNDQGEVPVRFIEFETAFKAWLEAPSLAENRSELIKRIHCLRGEAKLADIN